RDSERAAEDVRRAAGQARERHVRADQPVRGLVDRAVAAEGDHDLVARVGRFAGQLGRVRLGLRVDRVDLVAALERVYDEVLEPVRDGRRVRVDDHEYAPPWRVGVENALGESFGALELLRHCTASKRATPDSSTSRTLPSFSSRSVWPSTSDSVRYACVTAMFPQSACASSYAVRGRSAISS